MNPNSSVSDADDKLYSRLQCGLCRVKRHYSSLSSLPVWYTTLLVGMSTLDKLR